MRIRRILVRNFRGVAERQVELAATGVTIVQGPNEVGKSSLADAVDVLFDELHTTTKSSVRDLQPVARDVGTTVEVDAELGTYRFTYRKTFNRDREAVLRIHAPETGTWTGREAHDRMELLLARELDVELWRALRTAQGGAAVQADLGKTTSLVEALDRAAGTTTATGVEESLYAAVVDEHARYFTPTGRDGTILRDADAAVAAARAELDRHQEAFAAVERDVDRSEQLERRVVQLRGTVTDARQVAAARQARWREVEALADRIDARRAARDHAADRVTHLGGRAEGRAGLRHEVATARARVAELAAAREATLGPLAEAADALEQVERDAADARAAVDRVDAELRDLARRIERAHDRRELRRLRGELARAERARAQRRTAAAAVAGLGMDDATLERVRAADRDLRVATAALEAAGTAITVTAAGDVAVTVDGDARQLASGEELRRIVAGRSVVSVGELATVAVDVGGDARARERQRDDAARALDAVLTEAGVDGVATAEQAAERRVAAEQRLALAEQAVADVDDPDRLAARVAALEASLGEDAAEDPDVDDLRRRRDACESNHATQVAGRDAAEEAVREARATLQARRDAHDAAAHRLEAAGAELGRARARLAAERADLPDDELEAAVADAACQLEATESALADATGQLGGDDPDAVRALSQNAVEAAERCAAELREAEGELREVGARIDVVGEEGRFERLEEARAQLAHAERERARVHRRAAAARLLHDTMTACRDRARRAYLQPLRERIESLGRLAFGADLQVELDDESLAVARIVRDGVALPFGALSVGAQEQLAVVQRLACAMLVCRDGRSGVPLVLDDALGFSDPERLEAMGAVLRLAGERCQVLVLTCVPDRYRHVGGADVLTLA